MLQIIQYGLERFLITKFSSCYYFFDVMLYIKVTQHFACRDAIEGSFLQLSRVKNKCHNSIYMLLNYDKCSNYVP